MTNVLENLPGSPFSPLCPSRPSLPGSPGIPEERHKTSRKHPTNNPSHTTIQQPIHPNRPGIPGIAGHVSMATSRGPANESRAPVRRIRRRSMMLTRRGGNEEKIRGVGSNMWKWNEWMGRRIKYEKIRSKEEITGNIQEKQGEGN